MEVMSPIHNMDFDFKSSLNSPVYMSAPSTPKGFGGDHYFSAPTSPTRISQFCKDFEDFLIKNEDEEEETCEGEEEICVASVPFAWEEKPGKPKSPKVEFAFDISEDLETSSVSAEELFDGGVIKTAELPARISQRSRSRKEMLGSFSPRQKKEFESDDRFAKQSTRRTPERERGRERTLSGISSNSRRETRSLSPLRVSEYLWDEEEEQEETEAEENQEQQPNKEQKAPISDDCSVLTWSSSKSFTNWSFKDLFLFRSASEGRAADKDPFSKYRALRRYESSSTTRAIENGGSVGSNSRRRRGGGPPVSAHELHYTINRAVSEDMKKKTFLPYKQGILGRLAFNPAAHALANGFGFNHN